MTCPLLPAYKWQQIARWAVTRAARLGVLLESEDFYAAPEAVAESNRFGLLFFFPANETDLAILKAAPTSGMVSVNAASELPAEELLSLRDKVQIEREDRTYDACKAFILDTAQSAKDLDRSQACSRAMFAIQQARTVRERLRLQQELERRRQEELRQARREREEMERLQQEMEAREQETEAREQEEEARASRRRIFQAIGAGLSAYGQGLQGGTSAPTYDPPSAHVPSRPRPPAGSLAAPGCSSDFQCGFGNVCVKPNYSTTGTCMRSVNDYGNPTFNPPRTDSVMPKFPSRTDCKFFTDCPIGFRCDTASGTCVK